MLASTKTFCLVVLTSSVCYAICRIILQVIRIKSVPHHLPWAGVYNDSILAKLIACFGEPFAGRKRIEEGYDKYGRHGLPFILPALFWPAIVLPPSDISWVGHQPEEILNHVKPFDDIGSFDFLAHGPNTDSVHDFTVIRRNLTRQMRTLVPQALDEIAAAIDEELGLDCDEWKEIKISEVVQNVSFRAANRIFVGLPLCRDRKFSKALEWWLVSLSISSAILRYAFPFPWRTWIAPLFAVIPNLQQYYVLSYVLPAVRQRIARFQRKGKSDMKSDEPNDMIQWIIDTNAEKMDPAELHPYNVAGKLMFFNFFAVNTTSLVAQSVIVDLLRHESASDLIAQLQQEADAVMPHVLSNSKVLYNMQKTDSAIRETLRFDPFLGQAMVRQVMPSQGLETPSGLQLPQGCHVHSIVSSMQRDDNILAEASKYQPLRYYLEGLETGKQQAAVRLDDTYLSFGLGRFACPGRFFALHSLKLIIGYLLSHYDLEQSPNNKKDIYLEIGDAKIISPKLLIRCRRRRSANDADDAA